MKNLRLVLLGLAAVIGVYLGVLTLKELRRTPDLRATMTEVVQAPPRAPQEKSDTETEPATKPIAPPPADPAEMTAARAEIEQELAAAPEYLRFFDALKLAFPGDYDSILEKFAWRRSATHAADPLDLLLSEASLALRQSRGVLAAHSDAASLTRMLETQLAMVRALGNEDPHLCVDFLYGNSSEGFFSFTARNRQLNADLALAGLDAIVNGNLNKINRTGPTDEDFQILEKAMTAKGLGAVEIGALLDGKNPDPPLPDTTVCRASQLYLESLRELPEPIRLRIFGLAVELMARS
jgi:hypothetical protein